MQSNQNEAMHLN